VDEQTKLTILHHAAFEGKLEVVKLLK
jgi:hypothetical protein